MKCIDKTELERFLQAKIERERMLAIDEHLEQCPECKSILTEMAAFKKAGAQLGAELLLVGDCPEYEDLSALADGILAGDRLLAMKSHVNSCELCSEDLAHIQELRSHAAMRQTITVQPGASLAARKNSVFGWKWVFAGSALVAAVVAVIGLTHITTAPTQHNQIAVNTPPAKVRVAPAPPVDTHVAANTPDATKPIAPTVTNTPPPAPTPKYVAVLRDGGYLVIKQNHKLVLARADGSSAQTALEARIEAAIAQKLRTGKIKPAPQVMVAMATMHVRSGGYAPPATAPKLVGPVDRVVMTSRPTFTWSKVDLAESYNLKVTDTKGNAVFEGTSSTNSLTLSEPLARGRTYIWQVGVRFSKSDAWANSSIGGFTVLPDDSMRSIAKVERQLPGSHLALGATYESLGLYDEAAREYRALRRANPGSALARKLLNNAVQAGQ